MCVFFFISYIMTDSKTKSRSTSFGNSISGNVSITGSTDTSIGGPVTSTNSGNSSTLPSTIRPICKIGNADSEAIWRDVIKFPNRHMLIPKNNNEYSGPVPDPGKKRKTVSGHCIDCI